jgi:hypothetical protein
MQWDERFNLIEHGDRFERQWWPFLKNDFDKWEKFWLHHIIPLTNRIDDNIDDKEPSKLFLREDNKIDKHVESMMMANYSVFYYIARANEVVKLDSHGFPEDAFIFLQAATENARNFIGIIRKDLSPKLQLNLNDIPEWKHIEAKAPIDDIKRYRNAFIHSPRLGRSPLLQWECIPKASHIKRAARSWSYVQGLPLDCFVESRPYLQKLLIDLMRGLNPAWEQVRKALDSRRTSQAYRQLYRLDSQGRPLPRPKK